MVIAATMVIGFLAGLWSFKAKTRWCSVCGAAKCCPKCAAWVVKAAGVDPDRGPAEIAGPRSQSGSKGRGDG
jgi:hypothetical protein